jgi:RES domain-containing protein
MHTAWRLTKAKYRDQALSGYGSMLHGGRWHTKGVPVVYAADSPALALLETMVHVEEADLLAFEYVVIPIRFEDRHLTVLPELPEDWNAWPWPMSTQRLGTRWFEERRSPILRIPSAVVSHQLDYLINPLHPDFGKLDIGPVEPFPIDPRFGRR